MAEFAQIDADNVVIRVLVVPDEQAHRGNEFLCNDLALGGRWIQATDENNVRKYRSGVGSVYDELNDVFLYAQPAPWFVLDETFDWVCPEGINPTTGETYTADELLLIDLSSRVYAGINLSEVPL